MRFFALIAMFAFQLSVFTCGFDIHVHTANADIGHISGHLHDAGDKHNNESGKYDSCHVHASHTFAVFDAKMIGKVVLVSKVQAHLQPAPSLKRLPFLIDHPPKSTV